MKRLAFQTTLLGVLLAPASVLAQDSSGLTGSYAGFSGGLSFLWEQNVDTDFVINGEEIDGVETDIDYDTGFRFGGFAGFQLSDTVRLQAEISYIAADAESTLSFEGIEGVPLEVDTTILSGTGGVYFDFAPIRNVVPYIGLGGGLALVESEFDVDDDGLLDDAEQTVLTAFGEAGVSFDLTPNLAIVPSGRISWYNTKKEAQDVAIDDLGVVVDGVLIDSAETEFVLIDKGLVETQLFVSARYRF